MNELVIKYAISTKIKLQALIAAIYLLLMSLTISVLEMSNTQYGVYFFVGVVGIILAVSLILSVTISQPKPLIILNREFFSLKLPKQRLDTIIYWEETSHIGIGLSHIVLNVQEEILNVDLDILRYHDLKALKSNLIEIAEARKTPYNNI